MRLEHTRLPIEYQGVAEAGNLHLIPSLAENYITLEDFILEGRSEAALTRTFFHMFLNLPADATHSSDLCSGEFCNLEFAIEHTLNESGVFVNFEGLSDEFELLHDLELAVHFNHCSCNTDSEVTYILAFCILQLLNANESSSHCISRAVECCITKTELRCVFKLS
jgi:hypothetical protein